MGASLASSLGGLHPALNSNTTGMGAERLARVTMLRELMHGAADRVLRWPELLKSIRGKKPS